MPYDVRFLDEDGSLSLNRLREWAIAHGGNEPAHVGYVYKRSREEQQQYERERERLAAATPERVRKRVKEKAAANAALRQLRMDCLERYVVLLNRERIKRDLPAVEYQGVDSQGRPIMRVVPEEVFDTDKETCLHNMGLVKRNGKKLCPQCGTPIS